MVGTNLLFNAFLFMLIIINVMFLYILKLMSVLSYVLFLYALIQFWFWWSVYSNLWDLNYFYINQFMIVSIGTISMYRLVLYFYHNFNIPHNLNKCNWCLLSVGKHRFDPCTVYWYYSDILSFFILHQRLFQVMFKVNELD